MGPSGRDGTVLVEDELEASNCGTGWVFQNWRRSNDMIQ